MRNPPRLHFTLAVAIICFSPSGYAATLHVPADFPTIQSCIDAAVSGQDECLVAPGTYNELVDFLRKAITLRSSQGPEVTTIDGTRLSGSVVTFVHSLSFPILEGFTITGGTGLGPGFSSGGGIYNYNSSPRVTNCIFRGNSAYYGGGMYNQNGSMPTISNCTFIGNTALDRGGGMYNEASSPTLTNCSFIENMTSSYGFGEGGGMFNQSGTVTLTHCRFVANTAYGIGGGGMYNQFGAVAATNCTFIGSGMSNYNCTLSITNCTFTAQSAMTFGGTSTTLLSNSVFWPNQFDYFLPLHTTMYFFFDVMSGYLPYGADNGTNMVLDPLFVRSPNPGPDGQWDGIDDDYGDLRLQAGSPCVNAGDPDYVPPPGEPDLNGNARVLCGRVDIGAYEFGLGDFNCDQVMDLTDLAWWPRCATDPIDAAFRMADFPASPHRRSLPLVEEASGCEASDFEYDGDVDLKDFAAWQNLFGQ